MAALAVAIRVTNADGWLSLWFLLFFFIGLPLFLVTLFDFGRAFRSRSGRSKLSRTAGFLFGLPQAAFGLVCVVIGVIMSLGIWYKLATEGHLGLGYGWTLVFELGPATLIWYGVRWMRRAFSRDDSGSTAP
jgi:hypothetical protein